MQFHVGPDPAFVPRGAPPPEDRHGVLRRLSIQEPKQAGFPNLFFKKNILFLHKLIFYTIILKAFTAVMDLDEVCIYYLFL